MLRYLTIMLVFGLVATLTVGSDRAAGQTVLKRLEQRIRERVEQDRDEVPPPAETPGPEATEPPGEGPEVVPPAAEPRELIPRPDGRRVGTALRGLFNQFLGEGGDATDGKEPSPPEPVQPRQTAPALAEPPAAAAEPDRPTEALPPALVEPFPQPLEPTPTEPPDELARLRQRVKELEARVEALERQLQAEQGPQ